MRSTRLKVLRLPEVVSRIGLCRDSIYRLMNEGKFPRNFDIGGGRAVGWLESEVEAHIAQCAARRVTAGVAVEVAR